jgi:hypothetical protein
MEATQDAGWRGAGDVAVTAMPTQPTAQDYINILTAQRNAALDDAARWAAHADAQKRELGEQTGQLAAKDGRIAELEKLVPKSRRKVR